MDELKKYIGCDAHKNLAQCWITKYIPLTWSFISIATLILTMIFNVNKKIMASIKPVNIGGINMYPSEFELIEIYHKLYSPNYASEWSKLKEWEQKLVKLMYSRKKIMGGYKSNKTPSVIINNNII